MINFYLPNFYDFPFCILNAYFIENIKENPDLFYDDVQIGAVYGTFPSVIWNGGRFKKGSASIKEICNTISYYNNVNIPIRFTYTNTLIEEKHLEDVYANIVTELANNGKNEILVNHPILEEYLRNRYPEYKFLSSTTKCMLDNNDIIAESDKYFLTVLDYRKNTDFDFLASLPNPEKYEILINAYCSPYCKNRSEHYDILSASQLEDVYRDIQCPIKKDSFFEALKEFSTVIKVEDLYTTYVNMGFKHFKIEGRTNNIIDVLESYIYYMVKPEYHNKVRYEVLKNILN